MGRNNFNAKRLKKDVDFKGTVTNDCHLIDENTGDHALSFYKNMPLNSTENMPLVLLGQPGDDDGRCVRRYTRAKEIENLAIKRYNETGKGITFNDLLSSGLVLHKRLAQITLKYHCKRDILFTLANHKPQQYYPACLKSNILKANMSKNIPIESTGVGLCNILPSRLVPINATDDEPYHSSSIVANQSLEGYVLPLLPSAPLHIHKIQLKLKVHKECYSELDIATDRRNRGKEQVEVIGTARACYRFYSNGTVMVSVENSNNPLKLEDEVDLSRLFVFFGQVKDRLVAFLMDKHERLVPDILDWELTQCDVNKDVRVSDWFQYTAVKIQVKHFGHLLRVYIKSMGKDTVCRVEESLNPKAKSSSSSAIEAVTNIFNPFGAIENKIFEIGKKVDVLYDSMVSSSGGTTSSNDNCLGNIASRDDISNETRRSSQI
jgi:hypothetical protein